MAKIYRADEEASRRAAAQLNASLADYSRPVAPTRPTVAPVAARPQVQQPLSTRLGRRIGDDAAFAADALSLPANTALNAVNRAAVGARNVVRGVTGKPALEPAQVGLNPFRRLLWQARADNAAVPAPSRPAVASSAQTPATPATTQLASQAAAAQTPAPNKPTPIQPQTLKPDDPNTFTYGDGRTVAVNPAPNAAIGSVASQNFGTAPASTVSYGQRPQVANTFGLSANDPRLNEANQGPQRPQVSLRGPDAMSEAYNASADREARQRLASDLDSERFRLGMIAGEGGNRRSRAALEALGQNAQQRAQLASGAEALSAAAIQGRANRDNTLANTGLQEQGQNFRTQLDTQNRFDIAGMQNATEQQRIAAGITRPMVQGADGSYYQVDPNTAAGAAVTDAQGKPIRGAVGLTERRDPMGEAIMNGYFKSLEAIQNSGATPEEIATRMAELNASPSGQYAQSQMQSRLRETPNAAAIALLQQNKGNPQAIAAFEARFGSAAQYLGQ